MAKQKIPFTCRLEIRNLGDSILGVSFSDTLRFSYLDAVALRGSILRSLLPDQLTCMPLFDGSFVVLPSQLPDFRPLCPAQLELASGTLPSFDLLIEVEDGLNAPVQDVTFELSRAVSPRRDFVMSGARCVVVNGTASVDIPDHSGLCHEE